MLQINSVTSIDQKKHIAILDTSSVSFMQEVRAKGANADKILKDYDLILIPNWVLTEIKDSSISADYIQDLIDKGYPIYSIEEELYSSLAGNEEGNLFHIVCASANQLAQVKSYLRRDVEKGDPLDMDAYAEWIKRLYDEWPIAGPVLSSGRRKKKNAGEVSITILAEVISWYYPQSEAVTIYSQDRDTLEFQRSAEEQLRRVFASRTPVPISYKSNDAILCQLCRLGIISIDQIGEFRKNERKITYSRAQIDQSIVLVTEYVNNEDFVDLVQDSSVHIIF